MRGFRTKIAIHVAFLVLLSAVITDVLVVIIAQGVLVRGRMSQQRVLMQTLGSVLVSRNSSAEERSDHGGWTANSDLAGDHGDLAALIVDHEGGTHLTLVSESFGLDQLRQAATAVLETGKPRHEFIGVTPAVFWWHHQYVLTAVPILIEDRLTGAAVTIATLEPIYAKLRQYNKPVFVYIAFNTIILCVIGLYRIFRIYLRPIDRIIRQADDYDQDEDFFFTFRNEDNELNRLSSSLNRMLNRISGDKQKLTETVASLERANKELKIAQNEMIRAEKLASVGRLAAGIAHEIGNPIGIVIGYMDLLKQPDLDRADHDDFVLRAEKEIQRINIIIRRLLDLARPKESASQSVSVHALIEDIVEVMRHQPLMGDIEFKTTFQAEMDRLWVNADQLHQVFLNLLLNAADAIREAGGPLEGCIAISTALAWDRATGPRRWLSINVEDNGEGIAPDQIENIFDPFYTTKEPGKGTGLGLAVSYMIIERMGGTMAVQSRQGKGTTMTLRLPLMENTGTDESTGNGVKS